MEESFKDTEFSEVQENDENKVVAVLNYTITVNEYEAAFREFQKKYVYPKSYVMTAGFAIILVVYIWQLIKDPSYQIAWFLSIVSLFSIVFMWYNPHKIRKNLIKSIQHIKDDRYTTEISESGIKISVEIAETDETNEDVEIEPTFISYELDNPEIIENNEMFIVYLKKRMFYVIPKRDIDDGERKILTDVFSGKLGKRYFKK